MGRDEEQTKDQYYDQVAESIKDLFELSTRIDERVQFLTKKTDELENKSVLHFKAAGEANTKIAVLESKNGDKLQESINKLDTSLRAIELKVQALEGSSQSTENRWKTILGFALQAIWTVAVAYVLFKLGLQNP